MYQLRPYQTKLVNEARNFLSQGYKGVLIQSPPGSGKSVVIAEIARLATNKGGYILFLAHRKELLDNIDETFKENNVDLSKVVILSPGKVVNRFANLPKPTLIITDEGHHGKAATYKKIYDFYKNVPRLGFTATPWRMNGEGFTDIYEKMVTGPSIQWLIDNHCLAPYRWYSIPLIDRMKVDFKNATREAHSAAELYTSDATIQGDILKNYRKYAEGRQAIVYAPTIEVSKMIVDWFNNSGIHAVHADGKTPPKERNQIMRDFKTGRITILSNVDLISEGFNVPDVGVIILCRPTQSLVLHLQQSMRGMRYKDRKESIILDHVGNGANIGLPTDEFEWTIESRARKKSSSDGGPPKMTCPTCAQQFLLKSLLKKNDKPHCPFCLSEIEIEERKSEVTFDETVEMIELNAEKAKIVRLSKQQYKHSKGLSANYDIAKAKVKIDGKGNTLYKLFGSLTAYKGKEYSMNELEQLSIERKVSLDQIIRAYQWALNKHNEQQTTGWQAAAFY